MSSKRLINCIFCLQTKEHSDEHVMPYSLGGNLTIQCVCEGCNGKLSPLDQSLADASLLVLPRLASQPDATWGKSAQITPDSSKQKSLEIKLGHKFSPQMKAQLIFKEKETKGEFEVNGSAESAELYQSFFKVLRAQIKKKGLRNIPNLKPMDKAEDEDLEIGFRLILNRSNQVVFRPSLHSSDPSQEFETMVKLLEDRLDDIEKLITAKASSTPVQKVNQPNVTLNMAIDFGKNLRAVAKIAFTFLASTYGCDLARSSQFDELRDYIINGVIKNQSGSLWQTSSDPTKSMAATRFSMWVHDYDLKQPTSFGTNESHVISISQVQDRHLVIIEFYGQFSYAIDVGDINVYLQLPLVHEFDFTNRTNRVLPIMEVIQRAGSKIGIKL